MIKIFMTGDNHIGLKYSRYRKSEVLASMRIAAFNNMVDAANSENCDIFAITGDLFENIKNITKANVNEIVSILKLFSGVVLILPGNHDYYSEDIKGWTYIKEAVKDLDNFKLLTEYKEYSLDIREEKILIYPGLCTSRHSKEGENNIAWIKDLNLKADSNIRIGIAHGAIEGESIDTEGKYFLMTRDELNDIPMDVWLIGHTHIPIPSHLPQDKLIQAGRIFNAGTHMQADVNTNTEGLCFVIAVESGEGLKKVSAKSYISGQVRFERRDVQVQAGSFQEDIATAITNLSNNTVLEILLKGAVLLEEYENRDEIIQECLSRFIDSSYDDENLVKLINKELINKEFAETSFAAKLLNQLIAEPKEAQLMYDLLKSIKGEQK